MTQIAVSEEFATSINTLAAKRGCSPEELMQSIVVQLESDGALAELVLSHTAQSRIHEGIEASLRGELVSHEEVEAFFDKWEHELKA